MSLIQEEGYTFNLNCSNKQVTCSFRNDKIIIKSSGDNKIDVMFDIAHKMISNF